MTQPRSLLLRPARREDLPQIVALLADDPLGATREQLSDPLPGAYLAAFEGIAAQAGNSIVVATSDETVVGCLQLTIIPGLSRTGAKRALVEGVRVSSAHRSLGIGQLLLEHAIESARAAGCALVQLTTDASREDAHRFYERLGFVATHVGYKLPLT